MRLMRRVGGLLLGVVLVVGLTGAGQSLQASPGPAVPEADQPDTHGDPWASVTITVGDLGLDFGAMTEWEASLYAGAVLGEETSGRFTEWVEVDDGSVVFTLPDDVREGDTAPWGVPHNTYVRVRSADDEYPEFDLVSDPFTLQEADYAVHFDVDGVNEPAGPEWQGMAAHEEAEITVMLQDMGGVFAAPGLWEASLYAGPEAGEETGGRLTEWVVVADGAVVFSLPEDVREGDEAPWDEEIYVRIRQVDDHGYPEFDLVGRPFTLVDGQDVRSRIVLSRMAVETAATVVVSLFDMGLDFGAIENWEASLYAGADIGEETSGRFTEWVVVDNGSVVFGLPEDVREGDTAPWGIPLDTYVRIRSTDDEYPEFDLVSDPFTLVGPEHQIDIRLDGVNEFSPGGMSPQGAHEVAQVTVELRDLGGRFGAPGLWEASLYAGPEAGEETSGRFTEWVEVDDGGVVFSLPEDVREGDEAPWDEEIYVRIRQVEDDGYPEFDLVGRPFTLADGAEVRSAIVWQRQKIVLPFVQFLPFIARNAQVQPVLE